ncbi:hypothetical protein Q8A73_012874 [Channa argus]|nr:hypothetical protein Q8A73_012874 [Channa argus]
MASRNTALVCGRLPAKLLTLWSTQHSGTTGQCRPPALETLCLLARLLFSRVAANLAHYPGTTLVSATSHPHRLHDCHDLGRETIHCQSEHWIGTDGITTIEATYNGSHNFPIFLLLSSTLFLHPCPTTLIVRLHHPSLFSVIQADSRCQRGSGSLEAPTVPHKVSQEEKQSGEEYEEKRACFWCYSPPA